jgi:Fur family ferric uptake transcriptional regulator
MENLAHILKAHGLKVTASRLMVLEAVLRVPGIFDHHALLDACSGNVDRVTLYRTLHLFYEHKMLYQVSAPAGAVQYGLRTIQGGPARYNRLQLICQDCGRIISVDPFDPPAFRLPPGFTCLYVEMIVNGRCTACAP